MRWLVRLELLPKWTISTQNHDFLEAQAWQPVVSTQPTDGDTFSLGNVCFCFSTLGTAAALASWQFVPQAACPAPGFTSQGSWCTEIGGQQPLPEGVPIGFGGNQLTAMTGSMGPTVSPLLSIEQTKRVPITLGEEPQVF